MILDEQVVVIECRNKNERDNIISLFQENGFIPMHPVLLEACYIAAYKNTKVFNTFSEMLLVVVMFYIHIINSWENTQ